MREFLSQHGVAFRDVDIAAEPAGLAELQRLGATLPPVVAVGDRWVHGWNPPAIAALLGVPFQAAGRLGVKELIDRLDRVVAAGIRAAAQVEEAALGAKSPRRDRTLGDTIAHVFHVAEVYPRALAEQQCPIEWFMAETPEAARHRAGLVAYGEDVRRRLGEFFPSRAEAIAAATTLLASHEGPQTPAVLLERTVWHAAQHMRQVYEILRVVGATPDRPLTAADYAGLPLPDSIW